MPKFDVNKPVIDITGRAIPEDSRLAWYPFIRELEGYVKSWKVLTINFKFDFFNTSSIYFITRIFNIMDSIKSNCQVEINWYYISNDEDMETTGLEYKEQFPKLNINLIERK